MFCLLSTYCDSYNFIEKYTFKFQNEISLSINVGVKKLLWFWLPLWDLQTLIMNKIVLIVNTVIQTAYSGRHQYDYRSFVNDLRQQVDGFLHQ